MQPQPEIFGLHANADITCQQAETYELLNTVLSLQPRTSSSKSSAADSREVVVARVATDILAKVKAGLHVCTPPTQHKETIIVVIVLPGIIPTLAEQIALRWHRH